VSKLVEKWLALALYWGAMVTLGICILLLMRITLRTVVGADV
jgi:hypothetical protein